MPFPRMWKALKKEDKEDDFQNGYGKIFEKNSKNISNGCSVVLFHTVYVLFVHFIIYNAKHNPPQNYEIYDRK